MEKNISLLFNTAEEFGKIAKRVNESSKLRKGHSQKAMQFIDKSLNIGDKLSQEIEKISKANLNQRNQDSVVLNTCVVLKSNLGRQKSIIKSLKIKKLIDDNTETLLLDLINTLLTDIEEAFSLMKKIILKDNDIILMDKLILMRKKFQKESILALKKLAAQSVNDAENAIMGSSANLARGLAMVAQFKKVDQLIKGKKKGDIGKLIKEAEKGWKTATEVNKSSTTQLEFAEKVNHSTNQLQLDSETIREMVISKHEIFKKNLEYVTILTVLLALQFKNFLKARDIGAGIVNINPKSYSARNLIYDLKAFIISACDEIEGVADLNYDMTDQIHLNTDLEIKSVNMTNDEIGFYRGITSEVKAMTEATKFPIEGSSKNIKNGRILEEVLGKLLENL